MALTLAQGARSTLTLDPTSTVNESRLASDVTDTTEFGKGWAAAGIRGRYNELKAQALQAGVDGREAERAVLEAQAQDIQGQAQAWSPRVQNVTDVRSLRDAADWTSGAMGNLRTSVAPAVGGLVGAGVGLAAAPFTGGLINPVNAGFAGAAVGGYNMEEEEAAANAMDDPYVRANKSYDEMQNASRLKGAGNSMLEAAVPAVMGGKLVGTMGKGAVKQLFGRTLSAAEQEAARTAERVAQRAIVDGGKLGAAKVAAKNLVEGGTGEFGTEFTQSLGGQAAQNYLQDKDITDAGNYDYKQALNEGAAGAVGGMGMGAFGAAGEVSHAYLGGVKDKASEIKKDPIGAVVDFIADVGTKGGTGTAKVLDVMERMGSPEKRAYDTLVSARGSDEQQQAAAIQWAQHSIDARDTSEEDRAAAADFVQQTAAGNDNAWADYRDTLTINHHEAKQASGDASIADEIATRLGEKSKASKMSASMRMTIESGALAPDFSQKQLETTADIWRKQGVSENLLRATSDKTDAKQREMSIGLLGWIARGFTDADGKVFVPESFTKTYGENTPKIIQSAAKLAFQQGLIDHDVAKQVPEIMQQATKQYAEETGVHDAILNAIPDYARDMYSRDDIADLDQVLRHVARHGTNESQEKGLIKVFGGKEAIAQAMSKLPVEKSIYGNKVHTGDAEQGEGEVRVADDEPPVKYHGYNRTTKPFNTLHEGQKNALATRLSAHSNEHGSYARSIGAHDALLEQFGKEHEYLRQAEDEMLWNVVSKKDSSEDEKSAYMEHIDSLSSDERRGLLKALNKNFKFIRDERVGGNTVADRIEPSAVKSFRETRKPGAQTVTPNSGVIYLERKAKVDKASGEVSGKDEDFLTTTYKLIKHVQGAEGKEKEGRTRGSAGKGVKGSYESMLRGLAALISADDSFTGRIGFRDKPESAIEYMAPDGKVGYGRLPLGLRLSKTTTVADAEKQARTELKSGAPMGFELAELTSVKQMRGELQRLANYKQTSYPLKLEAEAALRNGNDAIEVLYDRLNDEWNSEPSELGDEIKEATDKNVTPTEHAGEAAMYRDDDGMRQGLGVDASGYEGGRSSNKAAAPVRGRTVGSQPYGVLTAAQKAENVERSKTGKTLIYPKGRGSKLAGVEHSAAAEELATAPLATTATAERINTYPFDPELQKALVAERGDLGVRRPDSREQGFVNSALRELSRRGLGKAVAQIGHIFVFTNGKHNALFMGWGAMDKGAAIGINAHVLSTLQPSLFADIPSQIRYILAHEAGHNLDLGDTRKSSLSAHEGYAMSSDGAVGALAKEMAASAKDEGTPFHKLLLHTPFSTEYAGRIEAAQRELFAQAYAMHAEMNNKMREHLPLNFAHMEALYGRRDTLQQSTETDATGTGKKPDSDRPVQKRDHDGRGQGEGLRPGRALGDERAATGRGEVSNGHPPGEENSPVAATKSETANRKTVSDAGYGGDARDSKVSNQFSATSTGTKEGQTSGRVQSSTAGKDSGATGRVHGVDSLRRADAGAKGTGAEKNAPSVETADLRRPTSGDNRGRHDGHNSVTAQLQAYLKQAQGKNTPLANALQREITRLQNGEQANGNTVGALKAAERQFGALQVEQTERTGSLGLGGILSVKQLDDAIYKEDFGKFDTVEKLQQLATHAYQRSVELEQRDELTDHEEGVGAIAGQLVFDAQVYLKNPDRSGTDFDSFFDGVEHIEADVENFVAALAGKKQSTQTADDGTGKRATKAEKTAAKKEILDTVGDTIKVEFTKHFGDNSSGSWTPGENENVIRLALNGDVLSTAYHESLHEFFDMLKKYGNEATVKLLERVASNEVLNRKIEKLLAKHPEAAAQVRESPEEAAAFLYQFWRAGQIQLGQEITTGLFNKIKQFFAQLLGKVSQTVRDEQHAEAILQAFARGDFKSMNGDTAMREASMAALNANTEQHERALDNLDKAGREFTRIAGRVFFSAEAMLKGTKNKHMAAVADLYNVESGQAKGKEQSLFDGIKQQDGIWMNRLDNLLNAYKPEDLELAREALSKGVPAQDRIAKEIVAKIEAFNKEMFKYISARDVRRWDDEAGKWVKVEHRKNYFTRVWDTNEIQNRTNEFRDRLLQHHTKELEATAKAANQEMREYLAGTGDYANLGPAARKEIDKSIAGFNASGKVMGQMTPGVITPEMVADAIVHRLLNSKGHVDLAETTSSLGMTPVATSVNRRSLSWIDDKLFDDFKSKDMAAIMSGYVTSMVKRAEYTRVMGHGSEVVKTLTDKAVLHELGGDKLVAKAEAALGLAIKRWGKAKAAAKKAGVEFDEPYPTLRAVGQRMHNVNLTEEQAREQLIKALKSLDQGFKAVMAMDGTLGATISQGQRAVNGMVMRYQTVRLLPLVTFSSVNDIMGIVANGGELRDAWDALVAGMREIRLRWSDKKTTDKRAVRAEAWGTVDAGSFLDNLGQTYGSMYMNEKARKFSNAFFKWNGMEGWNRAMRITATAVAERALKAYQKEGFDQNDKAAVSRFEHLFGKGFKASDIKLDADGELDLNDSMNQAAMMRWVSNAIMTPNAAHRTIWGSDARMAPFWMLKQFAYTFHRVMLKTTIEQAKLGNFRPMMVLLLGYAPVTIAADAVKEMLIPGDEPPWMKGGLDDYLSHAFDRSGVFGVPGLSYDALTAYDGPVLGSISALGGPTVGQLTSMPFDSVGKTALGAAPFGSLLRRAAD